MDCRINHTPPIPLISRAKQIPPPKLQSSLFKVLLRFSNDSLALTYPISLPSLSPIIGNVIATIEFLPN